MRDTRHQLLASSLMTWMMPEYLVNWIWAQGPSTGLKPRLIHYYIQCARGYLLVQAPEFWYILCCQNIPGNYSQCHPYFSQALKTLSMAASAKRRQTMISLWRPHSRGLRKSLKTWILGDGWTCSETTKTLSDNNSENGNRPCWVENLEVAHME